MGTGRAGNSCTKRKRVIQELVQGRDYASQLQILLQKPCFEDHGSVVSAEELAMNILRSFTESLAVLSSCQSVELCDQIPATAHGCSATSGLRTSQDSGESVKRSLMKDRRGCYKRKKTLDSRITVSATMEDGYAWRKYGQKEILNAKYPRCYFRCTHKHDQDCRAIKQVQRIEDESNLYYSITYFGRHTCKDLIELNSTPPQINSDSGDPFVLEPFYLQGFEPKIINPSVKEESKQEIQSYLSESQNNNNMSSLDSTLWQDLMPLIEL